MRGRRARRAALDAQKSALTLWRFGSPLPPRVAEKPREVLRTHRRGAGCQRQPVGQRPPTLQCCPKSCSSFATRWSQADQRQG
jgi:hypothetical protein